MSVLAAILSEVSRLGIELTVDRDRLRCTSAVPVPNRVLDMLRAHERSLIRALSQQGQGNLEIVARARKLHYVEYLTFTRKRIVAAAVPRPIFECRVANAPNLRLIYLGRPQDTAATVRATISARAGTGKVLDVRPWRLVSRSTKRA